MLLCRRPTTDDRRPTTRALRVKTPTNAADRSPVLLYCQLLTCNHGAQERCIQIRPVGSCRCSPGMFSLARRGGEGPAGPAGRARRRDLGGRGLGGGEFPDDDLSGRCTSTWDSVLVLRARQENSPRGRATAAGRIRGGASEEWRMPAQDGPGGPSQTGASRRAGRGRSRVAIPRLSAVAPRGRSIARARLMELKAPLRPSTVPRQSDPAERGRWSPPPLLATAARSAIAAPGQLPGSPSRSLPAPAAGPSYSGGRTVHRWRKSFSWQSPLVALLLSLSLSLFRSLCLLKRLV